MLYLKPANLDDWAEEYRFTISLPAKDNGFVNPHHGTTAVEFRDSILPTMIAQSRGEHLPEGHVPSTIFFLWQDDEIVGRFRIRHHLTEKYRERFGHLSFTISPKHRGQGLGSQGLALAIEEARKLIAESYILMSVRKTNPASLRVQEKNGAKIIADKGDYYLTRIDLK